MADLPKELTKEAVDLVFSKSYINPPFRSMERAMQICYMRLQGYTYNKIAEKYGINRTRPRDIVIKVMRIYRQELARIQSQQPKKLTNYEKIKNMSVEEMMIFLKKMCDACRTCTYCPLVESCGEDMCSEENKEKWQKWLESEAAEV